MSEQSRKCDYVALYQENACQHRAPHQDPWRPGLLSTEGSRAYTQGLTVQWSVIFWD